MKKKRETDNFNRMIDVQSKLRSSVGNVNIMDGNRALVREGVLRYGEKDKEFYCFLFSDSFMVCSESMVRKKILDTTLRYSHKFTIQLDPKCRVEDVNFTVAGKRSSFKVAEVGSQEELSFRIIRDGVKYDFKATTSQEKNSWMNDVNTVISTLKHRLWFGSPDSPQ